MERGARSLTGNTVLLFHFAAILLALEISIVFVFNLLFLVILVIYISGSPSVSFAGQER